MPILTPELIKSAEVMDPGWTLLKLVDFKAVTKDGNTNEILIFEGLAGPGNTDSNVERRLAHSINGKNIAGASVIANVIDNMLKMISAFLEVPLSEVKTKMVGEEIDFRKYIDKEIWGLVEDQITDGKTYKKIASWSPSSVKPF